MLRCKWREQVLEVPGENLRSAEELKEVLSGLVAVPAKRISLLGLKGGDLSQAAGGALIHVLATPTSECREATPPAPPPPTPFSEAMRRRVELAEALWASEAVKSKFRKYAKRVAPLWLKQPRPGKKLLVVDIDHTILDYSSAGPALNARPYLNYMFRALKDHYDYVLWSQTKWHWIDAKCALMGIYESADTYPCFMLDKKTMFTVAVGATKHEVKCLRLIWERCPQWSARNTLHIDDLVRNFVLNPLNGVPVSSYRRNQVHQDTELRELTAYLLRVAEVDDLTTLDHSQWKKEDAFGAS